MSKPKLDKVMIRRAQAVAKLCWQATHSAEKAYSAGMRYLQDVWARRNGEGHSV